jgi:hypothetical protein
MRDHGKLLFEHGIAVLHRPCEGGWVIVRCDGSTMLTGIPPWNYDEAWAAVEELTDKKWNQEVVRVARHPDDPVTR